MSRLRNLEDILKGEKKGLKKARYNQTIKITCQLRTFECMVNVRFDLENNEVEHGYIDKLCMSALKFELKSNRCICTNKQI